MRRCFFVCIGGVLGAIARYLVKGIYLYNSEGGIPVNTLIINITGSFILAFALTVAFEYREFDPDVRIGFTTGFLGAYTTFSTLCKEAVMLMNDGCYFTAATYVLTSAVLGLAAVYSGIVLARMIIPKTIKSSSNKDDCDDNTAESEAK